MSTAWVTGAGGLIGSHIVAAAPNHWQVRALTRAELDLLDSRAVREAFARERPQLVIHCAALSRSPACEADPKAARFINVEATRLLAGLSADIPLLFFSTDLVFDGRKGNYTEDDAPNPLTVYGETKVAAEQVVLANPNHIVVRSSLNGGKSPTGDRGFTDELVTAWRAGRIPTLFTDEFRSPLLADVTARAVWELVDRQARGIHHVAGSESLSRYRIGELVAAQCEHLRPRLEAGFIRDYPGPARSPDTTLNCSKAQALLSFCLPGLTDLLRGRPHALG